MSSKKQKSPWECAVAVWYSVQGIYRLVREVVMGIRRNTLPIGECAFIGICFGLAVSRHWDYRLFRLAHLEWLYPHFLYVPYCLFGLTSGFWLWGCLQTIRRRQLSQQLAQVFTDAGLKSVMGRLPGFVYDSALDEFTRKMTLTRSTFRMEDFQRARPALEGGLQIYIDEIKENREKGTVHVIYSYDEMPNIFPVETLEGFSPWTFVIGKTRSKPVEVSLRDVPHLLIAGQTGGGKSTFLRQLITTLYLNNEHCEFQLIDLKAGLELQLFENLDRMSVISDIGGAVSILEIAQSAMSDRMKLLKENNAKDLDAYFKIPKEDRKTAPGSRSAGNLNRIIIVVDEASELFLAGGHASAQDIQRARKALSQIARQGRAAGVHLIIATQRPDSKAIDSQVKANLVGVLCFQMVNDSSSILVLGNGRATDLPPVPGRAIWKCGMEMTEVQTPYLSDAEVSSLFADRRTNKGSKEQVSQASLLEGRDA